MWSRPSPGTYGYVRYEVRGVNKKGKGLEGAVGIALDCPGADMPIAPTFTPGRG